MCSRAIWYHASDFVSVSVANISANFNRLPAIGDLVFRELLRPGHWGLVWPAWGIAIVLAIKYRRIADWFLIATVGIPLGLYVLPFMLSSWPDPTEHVRSALPLFWSPRARGACVHFRQLWNEWRLIGLNAIIHIITPEYFRIRQESCRLPRQVRARSRSRCVHCGVIR